MLPFGVAQNRLLHAAQTLHVPVRIVDNLKEAHIFVTTKQYYRRRPRAVTDAERRGIPIYVLRANTQAQLETFLTDTFKLAADETDSCRWRWKRRKRHRSSAPRRTRREPRPQTLRRRYQHEMAQSQSHLALDGRGTQQKRADPPRGLIRNGPNTYARMVHHL